eukprot:Pgem_evm1s11276
MKKNEKGELVKNQPKELEKTELKLNEKIPYDEALKYHISLSTDDQTPKTGCYCLRCIPLGGCPIGCACNAVCGDCIWPGLSTIPFLCCMWFSRTSDGSYTNIKHTASLVKVDKEKEILSYYEGGFQCCYC